jgi:hypothetical protein
MVMRLRLVAAWLALTLMVVVPLGILAPALPMIFAERELAADLQQESRAGRFSALPDLHLRRKIQELARKHGFFLSTSDVIVADALSSNGNMADGRRVGYTLVLRVPIFWLFDFEIVAVREEPVTYQDAQ